ncbi:MAG: hypothetical protein ABIO46_14665 [Chitinophagales bacterium]
MHRSFRSLLKIFLYALVSVIIIGIAANIYAGIYLRNYLDQNTLNSDTLPYHIEIGKLQVNLFTRSVCATGVTVNSNDSTSANNFIDLSVATIKIAGVSYSKFLFKKSLYIRNIEFNRPVVNVSNFNTIATTTDSAAIINLYTIIQDKLKGIWVGSFKIEKGNITITSKDSTDLLLSIPELDFELTNIRADSTLNNSLKRLEAGEMKAVIKGFNGHYLQGLYAFHIPTIAINSKEGLLSIDSILFGPSIAKQKFAVQLGYQTDCIQLRLAGLKVHSQKFPEILELGTVFIEKIEINDVVLRDYRDMNIPRAPGIKPMPKDMLVDLPFQLTIDQVILSKADITYEELAEGKTESGAIRFANVKGEVTNISNVNMDDTMKVIGSGYVMNQAAVSSQLFFPLNGNTFSASVNMDAFDMKILNPMVKNLAPMKIVDGKAKSMQMWCAADAIKGSGQMTFLYSDLEVSALEKGEKKKKSFLSGLINFVANKVILEKNNPEDNVIRVGKVEYKRDPERNIINYSWNLIFSGFKSSIGLKEEKLKKAM